MNEWMILSLTGYEGHITQNLCGYLAWVPARVLCSYSLWQRATNYAEYPQNTPTCRNHRGTALYESYMYRDSQSEE